MTRAPSPLARRIGLLGDVHAEDAALRRALQVFADAQVDVVVCTGDVVDGEGDVAACVARLDAARVVVVRGNHDRWLNEGTMRGHAEATALASLPADAAVWLRALPTTARVATSRGDLLVCHGVGEDDMVRLGPDDAGYALQCIDELPALLDDAALSFVVAGHTHRRMVRRFERARAPLWFVNAGTLKAGDGPGFGVLDVHDGIQWFDVAADGAVVRGPLVAWP